MNDQERCPTGWVRVEERLPDDGVGVLVWRDLGLRQDDNDPLQWDVAWLDCDVTPPQWVIQGEVVEDIKYWMPIQPLPSAPSSVAEQPQAKVLAVGLSSIPRTYCAKCGKDMTGMCGMYHAKREKWYCGAACASSEQPSREQADKSCVCEPGSPCKRHGREQAVEGLVEALWTALKDAYEAWDSDRDARLGKLLRAMCGWIPGYRPDTDIIAKALAQYEASRGERQ